MAYHYFGSAYVGKQLVGFNPYKTTKFFDVTKFKSLTDDKLKVAKMIISLFDRVENTGKWRKCWLPVFSPFPTVFSKSFFLRAVKSRDCEVKS